MKQSTLEQWDLDKIRSCGTVCHYQPGDLIFSEGDTSEHVYFIESGEVQVFLYEFTNRVEIGQRGSGDFFGEMSVINGGNRTASVAAFSDTKLIVLDKENFLKLLASDGKVSAKVKRIIADRTKELVLKENLLATAGIKSSHLQVSIKGDPSLRESVFDRQRYESAVDKVLPGLIPKLKILLLERSVTELFLQFNSGEIRLTSIFDPFNYEIHPANKLIDDGYLDRHFPVVAYAEKSRVIRSLYDIIAAEFDTLGLPKLSQNAYQKYYKNWHPMAPEEIVKVLDKLPVLRDIPDFYLRNLGISITRDAIRMQFNCDGTHFVSSKDYTRFLADNLGVAEAV